ncbi:MAG TPA: HAD hydrolase family protein [Salinisphaeraceae bacterium]|nr:HAD hydrolase family protein [Salinisphaeraceae bacterium]
MNNISDNIRQRAARIRVMIFDVDGVMTDGKLYLGAYDAEIKAVHVHDGLGLKRLQAAGITAAAISGRPSAAIAARLRDLGVEYLYFDSRDKELDFEALLAELGLTPEQAGCMGDDLPDLPIMRRAGLALAVPNAVADVRAAAHWISTAAGGEGAVREACELLIAAHNAH